MSYGLNRNDHQIPALRQTKAESIAKLKAEITAVELRIAQLQVELERREAAGEAE